MQRSLGPDAYRTSLLFQADMAEVRNDLARQSYSGGKVQVMIDIDIYVSIYVYISIHIDLKIRSPFERGKVHVTIDSGHLSDKENKR